jgi:hypothetical protein
MHRVMAWGWASDADRAARWLGEGFVPLRVRQAGAAKRRKKAK